MEFCSHKSMKSLKDQYEDDSTGLMTNLSDLEMSLSEPAGDLAMAVETVRGIAKFRMR